MWVVEHRRNFVTELSPSGAKLTEFGGLGSGPGRFDHPNGIELDSQGNVYIVEFANNRVQKLTSKPRLPSGVLPAAAPENS